jgi:hypothetical protein
MILSKMKKTKNSNESRKKMMAKILNNQNHRIVKINHKQFKNYPPSFYQQNPFKNKPLTQTIHQVVLSLISFLSP